MRLILIRTLFVFFSFSSFCFAEGFTSKILPSGAGDNFGNHTATKTVNMNGQNITNSPNITALSVDTTTLSANTLHENNTNYLTLSGSTQTKSGGLNVFGRVGVGNTNPSFDFSVKGIAPTMSMESGEGQANTIYLRSTVSRWNIQRTGLYDLQFYDYTAPAGVRLSLQSGGNVGIGTTSPTRKLHVVGDGLFTSSLTVTNMIHTSSSAHIAGNVVALGTLFVGSTPTLSGFQTTGVGATVIGANCPATDATTPYTWIQIKTADGSTAYIPAWK